MVSGRNVAGIRFKEDGDKIYSGITACEIPDQVHPSETTPHVLV
jgi:hypothetical protein